MPAAETARLVAELTLKDKMSSGLKKADSNLKAFDKSTANTQKSLSKFGSNIGKAFAVGAAATVAGGVLVVNAAADYESAFAGVRKTVNASEEDLQKLSDAFRDMAKEIPISAAELATLGEAAGALGIEGTANIQEFVRVTALLGETTNLTADEAATSLGTIANVLGLTSKEYSAFASSLVALGNAGASTESQIIAIAERSGAAGELIGLTTEQVLGLSSAVASLGIEEEAGGSALQKFFIDTAKFVNEGGDELKVFAKVTGKTAKQFKKDFGKDAGGALEDFLASLGKLSQGEQLKALEDLGFNDVRITRTLLGLANNTELVAGQMQVANQAFDENTALTKEAEQRFKTFDSQLQITKNVLNDVAITIGSKLLPKITPLLQRFNDFVQGNQGQIEKFGTDVAKAFEDVADAVAKVDWQPFIDGIKFTADVGRAAIGIFQSMPDWMQKLIVAGFAVNKLTGGLVTSLGKDIFGAVGGQFFSRGSSPANPLWVQSAGGGVGGLPGAAAVAGGLTAGAAAAAGVGVVILSVTQAASASLAGSIATALTGDEKVGGAVEALQTSTSGGAPLPFLGPFDRLIRGLQGDFRSGVQVAEDIADNTGETRRVLPTLAKSQQMSALLRSNERAESNAKINADRVGREQQEAARKIVSSERMESVRAQTVLNNIKSGIAAAKASIEHRGQQTAAAIRDKDLSVKVNATVNVSNKVWVGETIKTQTTFKKLGGFVAS